MTMTDQTNKEVAMSTTFLPDEIPDDEADRDTWRVRLTYQGRTMIFTYRKGLGLRVCGNRNHPPTNGIDLGQWVGKVPSHATYWQHPRIYVTPPTVGEVLAAVIFDAQIREDCTDMWDMIHELGISADRQAEQTWTQLVDQTNNLRRLLGANYYPVIEGELIDLDELDTATTVII